MSDYCAKSSPEIKVIAPKLPPYPQEAAQYLTDLIREYQSDYQIGLVGSSLGGYLATWLNNKYGFRAVLINPAVKPYDLLTDYLGVQVNPYTQQEYILEKKHITELRSLQVEHIKNPSSLWLLQQQGDEVLDYQQAVNKYSSCIQTVEAAGNHSFVHFERYPEKIIQFLNL